MDITNHFVAQGIDGGIWALALFVANICLCFGLIGRLTRVKKPGRNEKFLWALGVTLAAHCTAFISVSYFDQIVVFWFWLLAGFAAIASASKTTGQHSPAVAATTPAVSTLTMAEGIGADCRVQGR